MFNNVGHKLQIWAKVSFWVELGIASIACLVIWIEEESFWLGLSVLAGSFATAWFLSLLVYGFGELIETTSSINVKLYKITGSSMPDTTPVYHTPEMYGAPSTTYTPAAPYAPTPTNGWVCVNCGKTNPSYCGTCGCGNTRP